MCLGRILFTAHGSYSWQCWKYKAANCIWCIRKGKQQKSIIEWLSGNRSCNAKPSIEHPNQNKIQTNGVMWSSSKNISSRKYIVMDKFIKKAGFWSFSHILYVLQYYPKLNNVHHTKPSNYMFVKLNYQTWIIL